MVKSKIICVYGNTLYYGHERSNVQVFSALKEEDFDLLVISNRAGIADSAKKVFDNQSIPFEPIPFPSWSDIRKPFTLLGILKYISKIITHNIHFYKKLIQFKPDFLYIGNDFMYISLIPSLLLSNVKVVYRLGDAPTVGWKPFAFLWKHYISKRTFRFVCISEFIRNKLIAVGRGRDQRDVVIYNFPPLRIAPKEVNTIPYTKKGITFSYLGQIIGIKGVSLFVDAAIKICSQYPEVSFLLAGDLKYSGEFADQLVAKVAEAGYQERIIFLGAVENIVDFFKLTDVLITPSVKEEPLGNVLVEAKTNHTPSIIFNSGGMPELIRHEHNGYLCLESTAFALETAIAYYLEHPELIREHGENAHASIAELGIDYKSYKQKWINVFNTGSTVNN